MNPAAGTAAVQLSRGLLARCRDMRTEYVSAEDSNTHSSIRFCSSSSRREQADDEDDVISDVTSFPDSVEVDRPRWKSVSQLMEKKRQRHEDALNQLDTELSQLSQVFETKVRTFSLQLQEFLEEADHTLNHKMSMLDYLSLQEMSSLWEEVKEKGRLKRAKISELNLQLVECEKERSDKIRAVLKKQCCLLLKIGFLSPPNIHRLIHSEAMMINQSLLANRRSIARLVLHLQEHNLQKESLLRQLWKKHCKM